VRGNAGNVSFWVPAFIFRVPPLDRSADNLEGRNERMIQGNIGTSVAR
jgi:hypothetical protein